jgi:sialic acid synthase SpsE
MIVSTGASTLDEVARAAAWLQGGPPGGPPLRGGSSSVAWLQCVSSYPTPDEHAAIRSMEAIRTVVRGPVGYSDHTTGVDTGAVAAALGATVLEKHLTWSKQAAGPDHAASLEPAEFRVYASMAREEGVMRDWMGGGGGGCMPVREDVRWGPPQKRVLDCEREVRKLSRQSVVSTRALRPGDVLRSQDLAIKRPGTGIEPWRLNDLPGKIMKREVQADWPLSEDDVQW